VQRTAADYVLLRMKTPWRNGTTHPVMPPLEFMQRLAVRVPGLASPRARKKGV
jgi:hypothetical protein